MEKGKDVPLDNNQDLQPMVRRLDRGVPLDYNQLLPQVMGSRKYVSLDFKGSYHPSRWAQGKMCPWTIIRTYRPW